MLRSVAVARIQRQTGYRTDRVTEIIEELQDAQQRLETGIQRSNGASYLPWFLISEMASSATIANEQRIPVPADFLSQAETAQLFVFDAAAADEDEWLPLVKDDMDFLRAKYPTPGKPLAYSLLGTYFRLFPVPDAAYSLRIIYYFKDALLTSDIENNWLKYAPHLLMAEAGRVVAASFRDKDAQKFFKEELAREVERLFIATESRSHTNRRYVMGGAD